MIHRTEKSFESLIGFGANEGDTLATFRAVEQAFEDHPAIVEWRSSSVVTTAAVTGSRESVQDDYSNAAFWIRTTLSAPELHASLVQLEQRLGRQRNEKWDPRVVDLDLLLYGNTRLESEQLTIPHPRMSFRRFVLEPAVEVAPEAIDPVSGMTLQQLLDHLDSKEPLVTLVTDDLDGLQSLVVELPFEVQVVDNASEFIRFANRARLVVSVFDKSDPAASERERASLIRFAENFAGPMLRIDRKISDEKILRELHAAFAAMQ